MPAIRENTMLIKLTRNTFIAGQPFAIGEQTEVDTKTGKLLIAMGKAVEGVAEKKPAKKAAKVKSE
jgi:hypothetical protein